MYVLNSLNYIFFAVVLLFLTTLMKRLFKVDTTFQFYLFQKVDMQLFIKQSRIKTKICKSAKQYQLKSLLFILIIKAYYINLQCDIILYN